MRSRCYQKSHEKYPIYGGRGIKVCERWSGKEGFQNFLADMGRRPHGKTLDRLDPNKDYGPDNCRWGTAKQQANNQRRHHEQEAVA